MHQELIDLAEVTAAYRMFLVDHVTARDTKRQRERFWRCYWPMRVEYSRALVWCRQMDQRRRDDIRSLKGGKSEALVLHG